MKNRLIRAALLVLTSLATGYVFAGEDKIDLSAIEHLCPKGRVQDREYNPDQPVVDALIEKGTAAIPLLIGMLDDDTRVDHQILDYYPLLTVGDIALIVLTNLTTDSNWKASTIPGASWNDVLGSEPDPAILLPVFHQLQDFKAKHGSKGIRQRWQHIWSKHREHVYWDPKERCFKLRVTKGTSNE